MSNIIEFEYEDNKYECDADCLTSYAVIYGIRMAQDQLSKGEVKPWFEAMDRLFPDGRHIEYVLKLGEDMEKFGELVSAAISAGAPKNS